MKGFESFNGKTAMVTGAGTGLGRGFALRLAELGATVVLAARREDRLEAVAKEIRDAGGKALVVPLDIRDADAVEAAVARIVDETGRLDILINNAAGNFLARAEDITPNGWTAVVNIVLNGSFFCARAAGLRMLEQGGGKILNVTASYAWVGGPNTAHSASAKAGLITMAKTLAVEWGGRNVQVNCLCPGFIDTEQSREKLWPTEAARNHILERVPAGRFGTVEETVEAGLFLCSDAANYVNGEVFTIDGGEWLNKGALQAPEKGA
ncbi:MAG: SDR family oxidoreductase [Ectothiorhodospiraceae bacterium]|nr:SDR family oxidoreductase [Ectothiorhodospiraceae bacterium]